MTGRRCFAWSMALAITATLAHRAGACPVPEPAVHQTDATIGDTTPPDELLLTYSLARGDEDSSCGELALLTLNLEPPDDEQTPAEQFGYRLELVDASAPEGLVVPDTAVRATEGQLMFTWPDDSNGGHAVVAFTIAVSAVDLAGNIGPPSELRVYDGGDTDGCHVASLGVSDSSNRGFALVLALIVALGLARRSA